MPYLKTGETPVLRDETLVLRGETPVLRDETPVLRIDLQWDAPVLDIASRQPANVPKEW